LNLPIEEVAAEFEDDHSYRNNNTYLENSNNNLLGISASATLNLNDEH